MKIASYIDMKLLLILTYNILRWGRPEAAEGGEVGRGALGKVRERGGGGG